MSLAARCCLVVALSWLLLPEVTSAQDKLEFNRDIRPILSDRCFACHGPDANHREAELRLDVREEAVKLKAIVPGKSAASALVKRILSDNPEEVMPPRETNKPLSPEQKRLLQRWIDEGAEYQGHWAYEPRRKASISPQAQPIDELLSRRQQKLGLAPVAEADRRTLIRRLSFDLLGLPPSPAEVEAFVKDRGANAYEQLVERLLASPHYGERMAIGWLDVVRFADTIGYHSDTPRNVYPYRDYVIQAFNDNLPFDQFTIEQLAGDLLPQATTQQKIASCFNRLLLTTEEGGAQAKDYEARMLGDRVRAVGTVWLGQTIGCAQCHDHKFDPITTRDFYSLGAFFADIAERAVGSREPGMLVLNSEQTKQQSALQAEIAKLEQAFEARQDDLAEAQRMWEADVRQAVERRTGWKLLAPKTAVAERGGRLQIEKGSSLLVDRPSATGVSTAVITVQGNFAGVTALRLEALSHSSLPGQGPGFGDDGRFVVSEWSVSNDRKELLTLSHAIATRAESASPAQAAIDGQKDVKRGWSPGRNVGVEDSLVVVFAEPITDDREQTLTFRIEQSAGERQILGRFRLLSTTNPRPLGEPQGDKSPGNSIDVVIPADEIVKLIEVDDSKRNAAQRKKLSTHFKAISQELIDDRARILAAKQQLAKFEETLPRCLVTVTQSKPNVVRILPRGNWMDDSGPLVEPALPSFVKVSLTARSSAAPTDKSPERLNRLDLARWLVSSEQPLTPRVFVNRLWKQFFGQGLSRTLDDLGSQGDPPVQAELLDWLASEFVERNWDVKHLVRTIVTSRAYRQSSIAPAALVAKDPDNRELARQNRYRLDAELVRDNALSIAGLLSLRVGGASAKPYQPDGYWENLNFPVRAYSPDAGENQYRRGLYTWWQRSFLHPSVLAFDAPTREECAADRVRSNIPQQALVLLNDPTYVEAARAFGVRIMREGASDSSSTKPEARLAWAWQAALSRSPQPDELRVMQALYEKHEQQYRADPAAAKQLLTVGAQAAPGDLPAAELAAWTSVARVILNLHETITRN